MSTTSWFLIGLNCGLAVGAFACLFVAYALTRKPVGRARSEYASNGAGARALAAQFPAPKDLPPLTDRQVEALKFAASGLSNQAIAEQMGVTLQTVKFHLSRAYVTLGTKNRTGAVSKARELGVLA